MGLTRDQRGFILSGIALLLALPAMLLAASFLAMAGAGGEAVSLQSLSDKVFYTAHDIERLISYMENNEFPIDNTTLSSLAETYSATTGLLVDIWREGNNVIVNVRDPGNTVNYCENIALA